MRKSELRINGQQGINSYGRRVVTIYKAMQYRWESEETADPQTDDESYHLTLDEAIEAADAIRLDLGFTAQVTSIVIEYDTINEAFDFGEEFDLSELDDYRRFDGEYEDVYWGATNNGEELDNDAIVVFYSHHRYMNYAYDIKEVTLARYTDFKYESDLVNERDSTSATYAKVYADIDELEEAFENRWSAPFDKINSGSSIVRNYIEENR